MQICIKVSFNIMFPIQGIQDGDLLLEFGSVNKVNFKSILDIASVVGHSTGQTVNVSVRRVGHSSAVKLTLIPRQGLIGCKIDPLPAEMVER